MMMQYNLGKQVEEELLQNILPFWMKYTLDNEQGGFYGKLLNDLQVEKEAPKGGILNARILWTFSAAARIYHNDAFLAVAHRAYLYLVGHLWDRSYGGVYWLVDYQGQPLDDHKQLYAQAFALYALAEYYRTTGSMEALERAVTLFELMDTHAYDQVHGGYLEACNRKWIPQDFFLDARLCGREKKSMNTMLHILEAYTNLFRVWRHEPLRVRLHATLEMMLVHILDQESGHFRLFFDEAWQSLTDGISYGHDIEGSWLLSEAAEVLGDAALQRKVDAVVLKMVDVAIREGLDGAGAIMEAGNPEGITNADRNWWPQAEAVVGFVHAYQLTGQVAFLACAEKVWAFIHEKVIDHVYGEWFSCVRQDGSVVSAYAKVDMWKCPYHNGRMCMEVAQRLRN